VKFRVFSWLVFLLSNTVPNKKNKNYANLFFIGVLLTHSVNVRRCLTIFTFIVTNENVFHWSMNSSKPALLQGLILPKKLYQTAILRAKPPDKNHERRLLKIIK